MLSRCFLAILVACSSNFTKKESTINPIQPPGLSEEDQLSNETPIAGDYGTDVIRYLATTMGATFPDTYYTFSDENTTCYDDNTDSFKSALVDDISAVWTTKDSRYLNYVCVIDSIYNPCNQDRNRVRIYSIPEGADAQSDVGNRRAWGNGKDSGGSYNANYDLEDPDGCDVFECSANDRILCVISNNEPGHKGVFRYRLNFTEPGSLDLNFPVWIATYSTANIDSYNKVTACTWIDDGVDQVEIFLCDEKGESLWAIDDDGSTYTEITWGGYVPIDVAVCVDSADVGGKVFVALASKTDRDADRIYVISVNPAWDNFSTGAYARLENSGSNQSFAFIEAISVQKANDHDGWVLVVLLRDVQYGIGDGYGFVLRQLDFGFSDTYYRFSWDFPSPYYIQLSGAYLAESLAIGVRNRNGGSTDYYVGDRDPGMMSYDNCLHYYDN